MIPNHQQFLDAIRERKLIRIVYYSQTDAGTVDRECIPLNYGQELGSGDGVNRYWILDAAGTAGAKPLGLLSDRIVHVHVLGKTFDPETMPLDDHAWHVLSDRGKHRELSAPQNTTPSTPAM